MSESQCLAILMHSVNFHHTVRPRSAQRYIFKCAMIPCRALKTSQSKEYEVENANGTGDLFLLITRQCLQLSWELFIYGLKKALVFVILEYLLSTEVISVPLKWFQVLRVYFNLFSSKIFEPMFAVILFGFTLFVSQFSGEKMSVLTEKFPISLN